jgi:hypothetical protein
MERIFNRVFKQHIAGKGDMSAQPVILADAIYVLVGLEARRKLPERQRRSLRIQVWSRRSVSEMHTKTIVATLPVLNRMHRVG